MTDEVIVIEESAPIVIEVGYNTGTTPAPTPLNSLALDVQRLDITYTMPTATNTFVWNVMAVDTDNIYNTSTGVISLPFTGNYTFNFMFNISAGSGTDIMYAFVQTSTDGVVWTTSTYSGRRLSLNTHGQQLLFHSTNLFQAGTKLRFVFFSTDNNTTITTINVPMSTAQVPAARLLITGYATT